jgi:hypothetical protein
MLHSLIFHYLEQKKFIYAVETRWFTRDWILKTVNKRWRDYKPDLNKQYFNQDERTLDQIEKDVPDGVNENQWSSLLGLWCSDAHKVRISLDIIMNQLVFALTNDAFFRIFH